MGLLSALRTKSRRCTVDDHAPAPPSRIETVVEHREAVSDRAVLLHLRPTTETALATTPGAHADLHLNNGVVRQYSLVNAGSDDGLLAICVQRDDAGRGGSLHVHDTLHVGEKVQISPPRNTFPLLPSAAPVLLLAAGVGITPLMSMAATLHRQGTPFELHVYGRRRAGLPLVDHLLAADYAASVFLHLSADGDSFRVSGPAMLTQPAAAGAIYACGPDSFVDLARERAVGAGWRSDQILSERFTPDAPSPLAGDAPFTVVAASTGERMRVEPTESIAEVLERRGYETYRSCGQGYCGSCITPVLSGVPDHRDDFQSDAEHASNAQINVCCSRSLSDVLELDV